MAIIYTTTMVPCCRASRKERGMHPVTVGVTSDWAITHLSAACRQGDKTEAATRLGGECCTQQVAIIRKCLGERRQTSDMLDNVARRVVKIRRERAHEAQIDQSLFDRLASKRTSKMAGFDLRVEGKFLYRGLTALAYRSEAGPWCIANFDTAQNLVSIDINGKNPVCRACDNKKFASLRSADNHTNTEKHLDRVATGISRAVAFLERARRNGLRWVQQ